MRYFHPMELRLALEVCGFEEVEIGVFGAPERKPTKDDWNIMVSAQRPAEIQDEDVAPGGDTPLTRPEK